MFDVLDNGDIVCVQGDDGTLTLTDLPTDKDYTIYVAIQDKKRKPVGGEIVAKTLQQPVITIKFLPSLTDLLTVPIKQETEEYYYTVKLCYKPEHIEDTLLLADKSVEDKNIMTVYPKGAEGTTPEEYTDTDTDNDTDTDTDSDTDD